MATATATATAPHTEYSRWMARATTEPLEDWFKPANLETILAKLRQPGSHTRWLAELAASLKRLPIEPSINDIDEVEEALANLCDELDTCWEVFYEWPMTRAADDGDAEDEEEDEYDWRGDVVYANQIRRVQVAGRYFLKEAGLELLC